MGKGHQRVRRRTILVRQGLRRTGTKQERFHYFTEAGKEITGEKTLSRIARLRIPPAWNEVRIAPSDSAPLQAIGIDKKGRTQYLYHTSFRKRREEEKFRRVVEFGESLPLLRKRVAADLRKTSLDRDRVIAAIVRLIDQAFFRIGNDRSARLERTYGLTTIRSDHVTVRSSEVRFDFVGKWRKNQRRMLVDADIARLVRDLQQTRGEQLFRFVQGNRICRVNDRHVNGYIQSVIGETFTAKDFRTWAGTLICSIALGMQGQAPTKKERKQRIRKAIEATAEQLGNTTAVCRASYICPRLIEEYLSGKPFHSARRRKGAPVAKRRHSAEELALLRFLRETIADRRLTPREEESEIQAVASEPEAADDHIERALLESLALRRAGQPSARRNGLDAATG
ncbi:MAG TPA: DNA topoisomerase IB [Thermoanaerobaculia bacterium]|nr:DNA topoisomerase IB [Thermoanaerobaculia bacterium]